MLTPKGFSEDEMRKIFVKASSSAEMLNAPEHIIILPIATLIKNPP